MQLGHPRMTHCVAVLPGARAHALPQAPLAASTFQHPTSAHTHLCYPPPPAPPLPAARGGSAAGGPPPAQAAAAQGHQGVSEHSLFSNLLPLGASQLNWLQQPCFNGMELRPSTKQVKSGLLASAHEEELVCLLLAVKDARNWPPPPPDPPPPPTRTSKARTRASARSGGRSGWPVWMLNSGCLGR